MLVFIICLCFYTIGTDADQSNLGLKPCPQVRSDLIIDINQLLGDWHMALVIMDDDEEEFEQRSFCIQAEIMRMNSTTLLQIATLNIPEISQQRNIVVNFPTTVITPGTWMVQSPFGGDLKGIIIENSKSNLIMMYCGWHNGLFSHIITIALTREKVVTPMLRLQLLSTLSSYGYDPYHHKIINWSDC